MTPSAQSPLKHLHHLLYTEMNQVDTLILESLYSQVSVIEEVGKYLVQGGGKRIRPLLTLASSRLFNLDPGYAIHLAAAVELIHTATLLHDDVVDASAMRRGQQTANEVWGNSSSVLVGDFLFSRAFQLMVKTQHLEVLSSLSNAAAKIAEGEVLQLTSSYSLDLSVVTYLDIITSKTAALFAAACEVGGLIAGMDISLRHHLYQFGHNLGMIFQIVDDFLDYCSNSSDLGKSRGDDFFEGKVTLPVIIACQEKTHSEFWISQFAKEIRGEADLQAAVQLLERGCVLQKCKEIAKSFEEQALNHLEKLPKSSIWHDLKDLISYSLNRSS
jgi:octaprenyl-diphosphate synthase